MKSLNSVVLTCEHARNRVPVNYRNLFSRNPSILNTHRAYDIGILSVAQGVSRILRRPLFACHTTRLLIDPNRSLQHPNLYSEFSRNLPRADRDWLYHHLYRRYRDAVIRYVKQTIRRNRCVLHLSLHSFTPVLHGRRRTTDIGILYDPTRVRERALSRTLRLHLRQFTDFKIRCNYPFRGNADGFTTALRRTFGESAYLGIEVEFNQALLTESGYRAGQIAEFLCRSLRVIS